MFISAWEGMQRIFFEIHCPADFSMQVSPCSIISVDSGPKFLTTTSCRISVRDPVDHFPYGKAEVCY